MGRGSALRFPSRDIWDTDDEADPQQPPKPGRRRARKHLGHGGFTLGEVDLRLVGRRRLESHEGLDDGSRTHPSHEDSSPGAWSVVRGCVKHLDELVPRWIASSVLARVEAHREHYRISL